MSSTLAAPPRRLDQTIRIDPVTEISEVPALAELCDIALRPDPLHKFIERYGTESVYEDTVKKLNEAIENPDGYVFRAVATSIDDSGQPSETLVGVSQWYVGYLKLPKTDPFAPKPQDVKVNADEALDAATEVAVSDAGGLAKGATIAPGGEKLRNGLNPLLEMMRISGNAYVGSIRGKRHVYLRRMMVHPDHQRKGIGEMLIKWGANVADREKLVGWLFARPAGSRLYEKAGWAAIAQTPLEEPDVDIAPMVCMLRQPRPWKGEGA